MNTEVTAPVVYEYQGNRISFFMGKNVMVNATQMAKSFGKRAADWLSNSNTKEFINALAEVRKSVSADLVRVIKGGDPQMQGTWMHEDVALEFARWLSPKFAIWCNDRIKELFKDGVTTITDDDEIILHSIEILKKRVADKERQITTLQANVKSLTPDAEYARKVLSAEGTHLTNVVAKEMGMSAVTLNKKLQGLGVQYKERGIWVLTSKYQDKGYTKTTTHDFLKSDGSIGTRIQTEWTEMGRKWLHQLHDENRI